MLNPAKKIAMCALALLPISAHGANILAINTGTDWANSTIKDLPQHNVTYLNASEILTVDFSQFDALYVSDTFKQTATPLWATNLIARKADLEDYLSTGGGIVVSNQSFGGGSIRNGDEYKFLPDGLVDPDPINIQHYGDDTKIIDPSHPLFESLTAADLDNWNSSYHGILNSGSLPTLVTNNANQSLLRAGEYNLGKVVVWTLDPDFHYADDDPQALKIVASAIAYAVPEPSTLALLGLGAFAAIKRRK